MEIGATFSHRFATEIGLNMIESLEEIIDLDMDWIRLACYWSCIARWDDREGLEFDFDEMRAMLEICEERIVKVIMVIGSKAPRWPEFYIPAWFAGLEKHAYEDRVLEFVGTCVRELGSYDCVKLWQVENEPLDPSGPDGRKIKRDLLKKEIDVIRGLDERKILLTVWGNDLVDRKALETVVPLADVVGVDLYWRQFTGKSWQPYREPKGWKSGALQEQLQSLDKLLWITELQGEPWEKDFESYKGDSPKSISPELMRENFEKVKQLDPEVVLWWGAEYWLWRAKRGDRRFLEVIENLD